MRAPRAAPQLTKPLQDHDLRRSLNSPPGRFIHHQGPIPDRLVKNGSFLIATRCPATTSFFTTLVRKQ
jgi:hypothetical protein